MKETTETRNKFVKWMALVAVVAPILFILLFTIAGLLRPGYSPITQTISDLGVGTLSWFLNVPTILLGFFLTVFAFTFVYSLGDMVNKKLRILCGVCIAGPGLGFAFAGIFPEPSLFHWVFGMPFLAIGSIVGFLLVGIQLRRTSEWRTYGTYSVFASAITLVLIVLLNLTFVPGTWLESLQVSGLAERVAFVEILIWYVVMGSQLFQESLLGTL